MNEGGLYAERQGWHLPGFSDTNWSVGNPTKGISEAGVAFYRYLNKLPNYLMSILILLERGVSGRRSI